MGLGLGLGISLGLGLALRALLLLNDLPCLGVNHGRPGFAGRLAAGLGHVGRLAANDFALDVDLLALHLVGGGLGAELGKRLAERLRLGALGELSVGAAPPHGVGVDAVALGGGVVLLPELARGEVNDQAVRHEAAHRDLAPLRVGDLGGAKRFGDVLAKLRLGDAGVLAGARRLGAVKADARHDDVAPLVVIAARLLDAHRDDVDGLLHGVELACAAVADD